MVMIGVGEMLAARDDDDGEDNNDADCRLVEVPKKALASGSEKQKQNEGSCRT